MFNFKENIRKSKVLYHGSPMKLKIIKAKPGKGIIQGENRTGVFLTETFEHAALYAIAKNLKGKTQFAVMEDRVIIVGEDYVPGNGYVYTCLVPGAEEIGMGQWIYPENISENQIKNVDKVLYEDYKDNIEYVDSKEELLALIL